MNELNANRDNRTGTFVDRLARALAVRGTRRAAIAAAVALLVGGAAAADSEAQTYDPNARCRPASMSCSHWSHCCSRKCRDGHCVNHRNAGAPDRRANRRKERRQDRRHDQRVRRKRQNRRQRRDSRSSNASAKTFTGNVDLTVINSAGRTVWFDHWEADGSGHELAMSNRVAGWLGAGQRARKVRVAGGRSATTLRVTNDLGVDDWLVEVRRSAEGTNVSLALGQANASEFDAATFAIPKWDTRKADMGSDAYTLNVPADEAAVTVLKMLDDGETVELTIEVRDTF